MKAKTVLFTLSLLAASQTMTAGPRSLQQAKAIAASFVAAQADEQVVAEDFVLADNGAANKAKGINGKNSPAYYILNNENSQGYVIVSGDDRFKEVLAYSTAGTFSSSNLPDGLSYWLQFIGEEMAAATTYYDANRIQTSGQAKRLPGSDVAPMLKSHWGQNAPFNQAVPVPYESDGDDDNDYKGRSAVGCVALGMAQVMNFWKYPAKGQGGTYVHARYGEQLSLNFDEQTYNWELIQNDYGLYLGGDGDPSKYENINDAEYTPEQAAEVAKLCYHAGLAADMVWNQAGDGESSTQSTRALRALIKNFGYNPYAYIQGRDPMKYEDFHALIANEIAEGRPVMFGGEDKDTHAGHFFVLDGYEATNGTFHINWGWQGQYDGYYTLTALEPGVGGIGAGTGIYNYNQNALIGIQPTEKVYPYAPSFYCVSMRMQQPSIPRNYNAVMEVEELTNNDPLFDGEFSIAVFDQNGDLKTEQVQKGIQNFEDGFSISGQLVTPHFLDLDEGEYLMKLMAKTRDGKYYPIHATYGTTECWKVTVTYGKTPGDVGTVTFEGFDDIDPLITSVGEVPSAKAPVAVEYYTLGGTKTTAPVNGIVIRKTTFADGTTKKEKVLFKN